MRSVCSFRHYSVKKLWTSPVCCFPRFLVCQAYRDGEWTQTLAGLVPSLALQQHRLALQRQKREQETRDQTQSPARRCSRSTADQCWCCSSGVLCYMYIKISCHIVAADRKSSAASLLCARKPNKRKRQSSPFKRGEDRTVQCSEL